MQLTRGVSRRPLSIRWDWTKLGRDNLSRVLHGARLSLRVGVVAVLLSMTIGGLLGLLSGYLGGWTDGVIVSLLDVMFAIPTLLLAMAVIMILGRGLTSATYAVAFAAVPVFARLTRVGVQSAKRQDHVLAARAVGVPTGRLLARYILPGCVHAGPGPVDAVRRHRHPGGRRSELPGPGQRSRPRRNGAR